MLFRYSLSLFFIMLVPQGLFAINSADQKRFEVQHTKLLQEYPDLLEQVFGSGDIEEILSLNYYQAKFKGLVLETKETSKIVAASVISAIAYGIIHDQVTARVCLEYFSQGFHKKMMLGWSEGGVLDLCRSILKKSDSPTVYALVWGAIATWWVGLPLGICLAASARIGTWPKITLKELAKPLGITLAGVGLSALIAGVYGYFSYKVYFQELINKIPVDKINQCFFTDGPMEGVAVSNGLLFIANAYAHSAAYTAAKVAGLASIGYVLYKRYKKQQELETLVAELKKQLDNEIVCLLAVAP